MLVPLRKSGRLVTHAWRIRLRRTVLHLPEQPPRQQELPSLRRPLPETQPTQHISQPTQCPVCDCQGPPGRQPPLWPAKRPADPCKRAAYMGDATGAAPPPGRARTGSKHVARRMFCTRRATELALCAPVAIRALAAECRRGAHCKSSTESRAAPACAG